MNAILPRLRRFHGRNGQNLLRKQRSSTSQLREKGCKSKCTEFGGTLYVYIHIDIQVCINIYTYTYSYIYHTSRGINVPELLVSSSLPKAQNATTWGVVVEVFVPSIFHGLRRGKGRTCKSFWAASKI